MKAITAPSQPASPFTFEEYYPEPLNKWLECHCYPHRIRPLGVFPRRHRTPAGAGSAPPE